MCGRGGGEAVGHGGGMWLSWLRRLRSQWRHGAAASARTTPVRSSGGGPSDLVCRAMRALVAWAGGPGPVLLVVLAAGGGGGRCGRVLVGRPFRVAGGCRRGAGVLLAAPQVLGGRASFSRLRWAGLGKVPPCPGPVAAVVVVVVAVRASLIWRFLAAGAGRGTDPVWLLLRLWVAAARRLGPLEWRLSFTALASQQLGSFVGGPVRPYLRRWLALPQLRSTTSSTSASSSSTPCLKPKPTVSLP